MRMNLDGLSVTKRALVKDFQLDVAGPKAKSADGAMGVEDLDKIDQVLKTGKLSASQRADLVAMRAQITRRPEADAAFQYILDGKRPINRLADARSPGGVEVTVDGKKVKVRLTDEDLATMTSEERSRVLEATLNKEGYMSKWALAPVIILFPLFFWMLFLDSWPWKSKITDARRDLMVDLIRTTPVKDQAELYAALVSKGIEEKAKRELTAAAQFFNDAAFDGRTLEDKAAYLRNAESDELVRLLNRVATTDGEQAQTNLGSMLIAGGADSIIARHAEGVWNDPGKKILDVRELKDIKTKKEYQTDYANASKADEKSVAGFVNQLPDTLKKSVWDAFYEVHDDKVFASRIDLRALAHSALSGENRRDVLVAKINAIRTKYDDLDTANVQEGDEIIVKEWDLLRSAGSLEDMVPFVYHKWDVSKFNNEDDILTRPEWMDRLRNERATELVARDQFKASLPSSLGSMIDQDFEKYHFEMGVPGVGEKKLKTFVDSIDLESIATKVVEKQTDANEAARILKAIEKKYGTEMKDRIARKVDWSKLLQEQLSYTPTRKVGTQLSDIKSYQEWAAIFTPVIDAHRAAIETVKDVVPTDVDKTLDAAFKASHDMNRLVGLMDREKTAREVVSAYANSGNGVEQRRTNFVAALDKVNKSFQGSDADRGIGQRIISDQKGTIDALYKSVIDYPGYQAPRIKSPWEFRQGNSGNETLDNKRWQDYLEKALPSVADIYQKFDADRKSDAATLQPLLDVLPTSVLKRDIEARFKSHDLDALKDQVKVEDIADKAVDAALEGKNPHSRWGRWEDDWASVKSVLLELQDKYAGVFVVDNQMQELEQAGMFDRLFNFINGRGIPSGHVVTTTKSAFEARQRQAATDNAMRQADLDALEKALDNLPTGSRYTGGRLIAQMKLTQTKVKAFWDAELARNEGEVKPDPVPTPAPTPTN
jgi:hypothetical protein